MKEKNIAILSMQRVVNYGSFLQAYGLKKLVEKADENANVYFIDIEKGRQLPGYEDEGIKYFQKKLKNILKSILSFKLGVKYRDKNFFIKLNDKFRNEYYPALGLDEEKPKNHDLTIIGSDEVFNCCQHTKWGFSRQLYGDVRNSRHVMSYAGSFGSSTLDKLQKLGVVQEIAECMGKMDAVSVRDDNSLHIVKNILGKKPEMHLDPVLMNDFSEEVGLCPLPPIKDYIIVYSYQGRIKNKKEIKSIKDFAKRNNKKIVSVFCRYDWCDESVIPDTPFDVIAWFKNADYIVTDTFHGTIFSIITRSIFCTLIRSSNKAKLTSLLNKFSLGDRIAENPEKIEKVLESGIDYQNAEKTIGQERQRTMDYLRSVITNI
ncbi:MAG: polysaccharide pyruvyl transferase family protein [Rikenellaceae bacterium]|nr:polysaccharide pyruvyl transferase family protein [Rikenellaceae bacterium]